MTEEEKKEEKIEEKPAKTVETVAAAKETKKVEAPSEDKTASRKERSRQRKGQRRDRAKPQSQDGDGLIEKVVAINRCSKVVKGGRRFSFSALVVVGDGKGKVGYGFGKANEVAEAIRKGCDKARRNMFAVELSGTTIPHEVIGYHKGGRVLLKPASQGTGIIAGGGVRAIVERAGIRDVLTKSLGSKNAINVVKATVDALMTLRSVETIELLRGVKLPRPKEREK